MLIPAEIRRCCGFVCVPKTDGSLVFVGTAFWVSRPIVGQTSFAYAVTAAHVIDAVASLGLDDVFVRTNLANGGTALLKTKVQDWFRHPTDSSVDVAVFRGAPDATGLELLMLPLPMIRTRSQLSAEDIGVGSEVFLTGLFRNHTGGDRNEPIVRIGNLAALPAGPVETKRGPMEAYLVEARSIGGLSGSPVFGHLGNLRVKDGQIQTANRPVFFLIGLMHGHFDTAEAAIDNVEDVSDSSARIHTGIGVVVPADRILEVVNQEAIQKLEADILTSIASGMA